MSRAPRNWGLIRTGETFEALATTIIFFEDAGARLFGRRGPDGGQDARSGDDKTVYQAKHHVSPTPSKAVTDATGEANKIAKYRELGHARREQWSHIANWVLITNASFNPADHEIWETEVAPQFERLGLKATYWEQATLDGYLTKHPEVDRAFFQNENRVLLSVPEACLCAVNEDPFLRRSELAPFVGRRADFAALDAFLTSEKPFLQVHAAGGTGKTRFLLEGGCEIAAKGEWQVLWANVHSMAASSTWFDAIVPERPTLLIVDEPDDDKLVWRLQEQLGRRVGRAQQWKIAVAVRSANDPILRALRHPKMKPRVAELLLKPLEMQERQEMCLKLFETGKLANTDLDWRQATAKALAHRFDGYPIWLSLAIHLLEEDGSLTKLPETSSGLCRTYLEETLKAGPPDAGRLQLARWVALLGPINREEEAQLTHLAERASISDVEEVRRALMQLVSARLLRKWGARDRLVDVKPDVLRDFILCEWLCEEQDFGEQRYIPSAAARSLIGELSEHLIKGTAGQREERMITALARTDFLLRDREGRVPMGPALFVALNSALPEMGPSQRVSLIKNLAHVAAYYPEPTLHLLRRLRLEPAADEIVDSYLGPRKYSQSDVLLELGHGHHQVARGSLTTGQSVALIEELYALVVEEQRVGPTLEHGLPNDGKRAEGAIRSLLENGPAYCREFGDAAGRVVLSELDVVDTLGLEKLRALDSIVSPLCDVQRHQAWSEGDAIQWRTEFLPTKHPSMEARKKVLARICVILEEKFETISDESRAMLWDVVAKAHTQANYAQSQLAPKHTEHIAEVKGWLRDDLVWVTNLFAKRKLSPRELRSARKLWHWHVEFGEGEFGLPAKELEACYLSHPTVQFFHRLTDWSKREDTQRRVDLKASELARAGTTAIGHFLVDAEAFLGTEEMRRVFSVAYSLGRLATEHQAVQVFLTESLRTHPQESAGFKFVLCGASSWVLSVRRQNADATAQLVRELLSQCSTEKQLELLNTLYGVDHCPDEALLNSSGECELVRSHRPVFVQASAVRDYVACTLWGLRHDWPGLKADLEDALSAVGRVQRRDAMRGLVHALHQVVDAHGESKSPADLLEWFWNQLVATPDLVVIQNDERWHLGKILKVLGKVPASWLVDAVRVRAALGNRPRDPVIDSPAQLLPLVELISADNVDVPEIQATARTLVEMVTDSPIMAHWLPKLLARVDPQGLDVPRRLAERIEGVTEPKDVDSLARAACYYNVGTPAWRQIARAAFGVARYFPKNETVHIYHSVSETGRRSWNGPAGELPAIYIDAVDAARRGLDEEKEQLFLPFWQWRLRGAQAELRYEEESLKEQTWD